MVSMVRVGDISDQIRGVSYGKADAASEPAEGYLPVLRAGNISADGLIFDDLVYVPSEKVSPRQIVRKGDVVIAASSGSLDVVGKAAMAQSDFQGGFGAFCKVLRPYPAKVEPTYFAHYFQTRRYRQTISALAAGANINNLKNEHLDDLLIRLPAMPEQRRIAAILDHADALRAKRREALALLDELQRGIFIEMFGDPVTNPKGWQRVPLGDVGRLDRGVSKHRPRNAPELLGGDYPLVQTGDVANSGGYIRKFSATYSELGLRQSRLWPAGTLCITIAANIAKTGILKFDACFPDSVVGFSADDVATVEFIRVWLSFLQKTLEDSAPESAQKNINLAILRSLEVPLPPLGARIKFFEAITDLERIREQHRQSVDGIDSLLASLQHRAFRGEL